LGYDLKNGIQTVSLNAHTVDISTNFDRQRFPQGPMTDFMVREYLRKNRLSRFIFEPGRFLNLSP
jgi:hypothetical protein